MHRIDTSTAQKDKFGAGKNGFTLGDAQTGVPPTEVSADILDALQEEICSVVEESGLELNKGSNSQLLSAIKKLASGRYYNTGQPLPTSNIGPIWHDDYASWMVWREFTANGANYRGYASQLIGSLLLDTQPTPRLGYIKSGVQNLSRITYAALRAWAQHNGLMVAPGVWTAGSIQCSDNADGTTFCIYDVRGEFLRAWDDSRDVDSGRVFGKLQLDALQGFDPVSATAFGIDRGSAGGATYYNGSGGTIGTDISWDATAVAPDSKSVGRGYIVSDGVHGTPRVASETRSRNAALLASIKY